MISIACPGCGERDDLAGKRHDEAISLVCGSCGVAWDRPVAPRCESCEGDDLQAIPFAIIEKGRGTQLSVVGIRIEHRCWSCDAEVIARWQEIRPNPILPTDLPTT